MVSLVKILAGIVLFGSLAGGCREAVYQLDEVSKPVEREVAQFQKVYFWFPELANLVKEDAQTYFSLTNTNTHSVFGIDSFDIPIVGESANVRMKFFDYPGEERDFFEISRIGHYGEKIETEKPIIFLRDGSEMSEQVFGAIGRIYKEVLQNSGEDGIVEEICDKYKKDIELLQDLVLDKPVE